MHMMVKGGLIPFFRHFKQKIASQHATYDGGFARGGLTEIMGKTYLALFVVPGAHNFLHDLDQDPSGIVAEG